MCGKVSRAIIRATYGFLRYYTEVSGEELLPETPFVLAANHCSKLDIPTLMMASKKEISFMMKAKYARGLGKIWKLYSPIILGEYFGESLKMANEKGRIVGIFPEGTRSMDGKMGPFRRGVSKLSEMLERKIVPARIRGTNKAWPKGILAPMYGPYNFSVRFGEPLPIGTSEGKLREIISIL
jgi:1-acyl-sn-glycerol-3-phosphate acyltransferase